MLKKTALPKFQANRYLSMRKSYIIQSRWSKTDRRSSHFVVIWGDRSHLRRLRSSPIDVRSSGNGSRSSHDGEDFGECDRLVWLEVAEGWAIGISTYAGDNLTSASLWC